MIFQEVQFYKEIKNGDPSIYSINHPDLIVYSLIENSIGLKWVTFNELNFNKPSVLFGVGITLFVFVFCCLRNRSAPAVNC